VARKRARERDLRRLAERRAAERRRARRRRTLIIGTVALVVLGGAVSGIVIAMSGGSEPQPEVSPTSTTGEETMGTEEVACGGEVPETAGAKRPSYEQPPEMRIDRKQDYRAILTTSCGRIVLDLFESETPVTVNNFVFLAEERFYDGTIFHRVIDGFVMQGGDPEGTGFGGPGYEFEDEIVDEFTFDEPGLLAMANSGPGTNGSQFFITLGNPTHLNGLHTIFGRVLEGMDVVERIGTLETDANDLPVASVYLEQVKIEAV
jgi:cyclophilin family peptidyl-prolyl cis-trans isomerase